MTEEEKQRMKDIDHTPPDGDGARAVWERGGELPSEADDESTEADEKRVEAADE